ncbi:hypothetical protein EBU95_08660, partial [bacterium]|nr:hypothetical protein [bacterium]
MKVSKTGYKRTSDDNEEPILIVPSNQITMKGVEFPVFGTDDTGYSQMMYPDMDYSFLGNYVYELPIKQEGGWLNKYQDGGPTKNTSGAPYETQDPYIHNYSTVPVPENLSELPSYRLYTMAKTGIYNPTTENPFTSSSKNINSGLLYYDEKTGHPYLYNRENLQPFSSLPMEGEKEFNLRRFVLNPLEGEKQTHDAYTKKDGSIDYGMIPIPSSKEETLDNVFKELYGHNLHKFKGDRNAAYAATSDFMKSRVEPQYNNRFYDFMNDPNISWEDKNMLDLKGSSMTIDPETTKEYVKQHIGQQILEKEHPEYMDEKKYSNEFIEQEILNHPDYRKRLETYRGPLEDWYVANKHMTPEEAKNKVAESIPPAQPKVVKAITFKSGGSLNKYQSGGTVSEIWEKTTGLPWAEAKKRGYTTGTKDANINLLKELKSGRIAIDKQTLPVSSSDSTLDISAIDSAPSFNAAFSIARKALGPNKIFEYRGRKYGTNLAGEQLKPSKEDLAAHGLDKPKITKNLNDQNKLVFSIFSDKETVKLEPEYQDWDNVKKRQDELNKSNQADIIINYQKDKKGQYVIVDKAKGKMHLYVGNKPLATYNIGTGENTGDEQTYTVIRDGKVHWDEGNKMTGAGIYTVSGAQSKNPHYSNAPTWNFINEKGIEVPMALHSSFGDRTAKITDQSPDNNRLSNGCINGLCYDLKNLYEHGFGEGDKLYVLPDDPNNKFEVSSNKLIFKSKDPNVNRTDKTLVYNPIQIELDADNFKNDVFTTFDFNDEQELETTKSFIKSLQDSKQSVMKIAKINGDVYNEIAKMAFGIYGTESNYGDTHSAAGNFVRAVNKAVDKESSSSPDYESKYSTYGADEDYRSVGLTQIRWNMLDDSEKKILRDLGITKNEQLLQPKNAAKATVAILAARYNNQLDNEEKKDIWTNLPKTWNKRGNYPERVLKNSRYVKVYQKNVNDGSSSINYQKPESKYSILSDTYNDAKSFATPSTSFYNSPQLNTLKSLGIFKHGGSTSMATGGALFDPPKKVENTTSFSDLPTVKFKDKKLYVYNDEEKAWEEGRLSKKPKEYYYPGYGYDQNEEDCTFDPVTARWICPTDKENFVNDPDPDPLPEPVKENTNRSYILEKPLYIAQQGTRTSQVQYGKTVWDNKTKRWLLKAFPQEQTNQNRENVKVSLDGGKEFKFSEENVLPDLTPYSLPNSSSSNPSTNPPKRKTIYGTFKSGGSTKWLDRYQTKGQVTRIYTDPEEFRVANQNFNDSLDTYNLSQKVQQNRFNLPEIDKNTYNALSEKNKNLDTKRWAFDEVQYKEDKKKNKVGDFKE